MMTWNWPPCVKVPFDVASPSMALTSAFESSFKTNLMRVMQWLTAAMFSLPPTSLKSSVASCAYLPMRAFLSLFSLCSVASPSCRSTYLNKLRLSIGITYVNKSLI